MKKLTQSILILTSLLLSTLDLRRLALKQPLSYLSLLFALAFTSTAHAQDGILIIGTPAAFNSGVMSSLTGVNPPSQPSGGQASSPSFIAQKMAEAAKQKEEFCKDKAQKIAAADAKSEQCKADADATFSTEASNCTQITKATISIGGQGSVNGDVNKALAAFNIKVGAVLGGNVTGTLEWNPNADCRLKLGDTQTSTKSQCVATAAQTKAALAGCP